MTDVLVQFQVFGLALTITLWKLIGYLGVGLFAGRWFVQMLASRALHKPVLPPLFWYMSIVGSLLLLAYFSLGKNDSVGILSNLFPLFTAAYNLRLHIRSARQAGHAPGAA